MGDDLERLLDLLDRVDDGATVGTSVRLPVALRDAAGHDPREDYQRALNREASRPEM